MPKRVRPRKASRRIRAREPKQQTLPAMFSRPPNKRKQDVQEYESLENDCPEESCAAKKAVEQLNCAQTTTSYCFSHSFMQNQGLLEFRPQGNSFFDTQPSFPLSFQASRQQITQLYRNEWRCCSVQVASSRQFRRSGLPSAPGELNLRDSVPSLPRIAWSEPRDMWNLMCWKDTVYARNPHFLHRHPSILPRMRAILLDWISEVCEVYKLHRETYHLTVDFIDRYLSNDQDVPKKKLQLVGVTALFIAAKLEEIYPPKCAEFASVTDGACEENEIREHEIYMLKRLNWALSPVTVNHWLTVYFQLLHRDCEVQLKPKHKCRLKPDFLYPRFNRHGFLQVTRLLDLCLLDAGSVVFSYGVLAASALCSLFEPEDVALRVSGFKYEDVAKCVEWMRPFAEAVREQSEVQMKIFSEINEDDQHNIQTHDLDLNLLDRAEHLQQEYYKLYRLSPNFHVNGSSLNSIFPTPPQSDERPTVHVSRVPPYFLP